MVGKTFKFEKLIEDPATRSIAREMVIEAITEGIRVHCRMPIDTHEAQQMRVIFDGLRVLGVGDVAAGIGVVMDNHHYVQENRTRFSRMAERIGSWVIIFVLSGVGLLLSLGIRSWLKSEG
jgi:hypothetical protein